MNLNSILNDLQQYKSIDKEAVLSKYINERLTTSLTTYYKELDKTVSYLSTRNGVKLLRKINEIDK